MLLRIRFIDEGVRGFDCQSPALRHSVARVNRQVDQDLLDLTRIDLYHPQGTIKFFHQFDVVPDQSFQHLADVCDDPVKIQNCRLK